MKMKSIMKSNCWLIYWMMLASIALCFGSCKDDAQNGADMQPFDPSKPVVISDFAPKSGGAGQRLVIYGKNFGNDPNIVNVYIGGEKAILISAKGESLYCMVPQGAYKGTVEVRVGGEENPVTANSETKFDYIRKMVASTLCGYKNEQDDQGWKEGKFSVTAGFRLPAYMKFDPIDTKIMWMAYDQWDNVKGDFYKVNFRDSTVTRHLTRGDGNWDRLRSVEFSPDGQHMIIANDQWGQEVLSTSILSRARNFKDPQKLTISEACNGASFHPNGELYYNSYADGQFFRFDTDLFYKNPGFQPNKINNDLLFLVQDSGWEFRIHIHPTGNYAYIVVINKHYILRTDYSWEKKRFTQPYVVCGSAGEKGWEDGVGTKARLNTPYQGVFVKNPEYAGKEDEYDFYFAEMDNHCIRMLTSESSVTTFAGRGGASTEGGYVDGDLRQEARFDHPTGIAYNEDENAFYICDMFNRRIRKIAFEAMEEE